MVLVLRSKMLKNEHFVCSLKHATLMPMCIFYFLDQVYRYSFIPPIYFLANLRELIIYEDGTSFFQHYFTSKYAYHSIY